MIKEVVIYGCGNMGLAAAGTVLQAGYTVACFVDKGVHEEKDIQLDGRIFKAIHPEAMNPSEKHLDILIAMAAAPVCEVKDYLLRLGCEHVYPAGDYIL